MCTRRQALGLTASLFVPSLLPGKNEFWNTKQPDKWSQEEIEKLTSDSPWAKAVNVEFQQDSDPLLAAANTPTIGRAGAIGAPRSPGSDMQLGGNAEPIRGGARRREPVTVRWDSGQPIRDAFGYPLSAEFRDRYVIAVTSLPYGIMDKPRRRGEAPLPPESTIQRQQRMKELLQAAATLEARGKEPAQAGVVRLAPKAVQTWLFGFSKEFFTLEPKDRDVEFILRTALISLHARFDPKTMVYRGQFAV